MREKDIERKLVTETKKRGGLCLKWVCPGFDGVPDRIVILPDGKTGFVEVKSPSMQPRPLQVSRHRLLRKLGCKVYVLNDLRDIPRILDGIGGIDEIQTT